MRRGHGVATSIRQLSLFTNRSYGNVFTTFRNASMKKELIMLKANKVKRRVNRTKKRDRQGAALVEFALVAPLMILFSLGLIEMGRMTMVKQLLTNISREGARLATLPNATNQSVTNELEDLLEGSSIVGSQITISPSITSTSAGSFVTVSISVHSENVSWLPTPLFMGGKSVQASTSMRRESL